VFICTFKFTLYSWYYSDTTPTRAEEILKQMGSEGSFIIRDSRKPGQYSLSVLW